MARVVGEFQDGLNRADASSHVRHGHHEDNPGTQMTFLKHVRALVTVITEMGNPFCDTGKDLLVLDTRVIADETVVTSITKMEKLGCEQAKEFFKERLLDRTKSISETLPKNKLRLFRQQPKKDKSRSQKEISAIRQDRSLFCKLYIACQVCDTDLADFFHHENQTYPPSLSVFGDMRFGTKSDLLPCLLDLVPNHDISSYQHEADRYCDTGWCSYCQHDKTWQLCDLR